MSFFKLLGEKKVHAGDGDLNRLDIYYPILRMLRDELERHLEYSIEEKDIVAISENNMEVVGINGSDMGVMYGVGASLTKEECDARFKEHKGFRRGKLCCRSTDGKLEMCYRRILIRYKK